MSTFLGLVQEIPGISVDRFDGENLNSSAYFLSHCHSDHMKGLSSVFFRNLERYNKYLYCSPISKIILEAKYNLETPTCIQEIPVDETMIIEHVNENDDTGALSVKCISAGHCPGSVMFLFEKNDKSILYTGDFRLNIQDYKKIKHLRDFCRDSSVSPKKLTKIYLDTTFLNPNFSFLPTRIESMNLMRDVVKTWLERNPRNVVILECSALYGSEYLYKELSKALNMVIHVRDYLYPIYCRIPDLACHVTDNPSAFIHACVKKCSYLKCRDDVLQENILTIIPSVIKWEGKDTSIVGEWDNIKERTFNVCYSTHSSFNELKAFIQCFEAEEISPSVCEKDKENQILSLLREIRNEIKKPKSNTSENSEKYTLQVLKREDIMNKPWSKYYLSNDNDSS